VSPTSPCGCKAQCFGKSKTKYNKRTASKKQEIKIKLKSKLMQKVKVFLGFVCSCRVTRVNSAIVLNEGLRMGEEGVG
jgi:hypothetical protein